MVSNLKLDLIRIAQVPWPSRLPTSILYSKPVLSGLLSFSHLIEFLVAVSDRVMKELGTRLAWNPASCFVRSTDGASVLPAATNGK